MSSIQYNWRRLLETAAGYPFHWGEVLFLFLFLVGRLLSVVIRQSQSLHGGYSHPCLCAFLVGLSMILGLHGVLLVPLECIWEFSQKLIAKALYKAHARSLGLPRKSLSESLSFSRNGTDIATNNSSCFYYFVLDLIFCYDICFCSAHLKERPRSHPYPGLALTHGGHAASHAVVSGKPGMSRRVKQNKDGTVPHGLEAQNECKKTKKLVRPPNNIILRMSRKDKWIWPGNRKYLRMQSEWKRIYTKRLKHLLLVTTLRLCNCHYRNKDLANNMAQDVKSEPCTVCERRCKDPLGINKSSGCPLCVETTLKGGAGSKRKKCVAITAAGSKCKKTAILGSNKCHCHTHK